MDDYLKKIDNFNPSVDAATGENLQYNIKVSDEVRQYTGVPQKTVLETEDINKEEDCIGSYMLPKRVKVKTYKLKKI